MVDADDHVGDGRCEPVDRQRLALDARPRSAACPRTTRAPGVSCCWPGRREAAARRDHRRDVDLDLAARPASSRGRHSVPGAVSRSSRNPGRSSCADAGAAIAATSTMQPRAPHRTSARDAAGIIVRALRRRRDSGTAARCTSRRAAACGASATNSRSTCGRTSAGPAGGASTRSRTGHDVHAVAGADGPGPACPSVGLEERARRTRRRTAAPRRPRVERRTSAGSIMASPSAVDGGIRARRRRAVRGAGARPASIAARRAGRRSSRPAGTRSPDRRGTRPGALSRNACELGVGRRHAPSSVSSARNSSFWREPAADDRVVAVEPERHGLAGRDLLPDVLVDLPLQLGLARWALPRRVNPAASASICPGVTTMRLEPARRRASRRPGTASAPMARKCTSGSRHQREPAGVRGRHWNALSARPPTRRVPDRRGVGALDDRHARARQRRHAEALRVVGGPARRRDLEHPHVVERALRRVEVGVVPDRDQLRRADRVGPGGVRRRPRCCRPTAACRRRRACGRRSTTTSYTFSCSSPFASSQPLMIWHRSRLAPIGSRSAATRNVGDLPGRRLRSGRRPSARPWRTRRRPGCASRRRPCRSRQPPKNRTSMPRAGRRVGLAPLHRVEDRLAGVLRRPDGGEAGRRHLPVHDRRRRSSGW